MAHLSKVTRKSQQLLDRLQDNRILSEDGKNWLISAIDPFHDTDISLAGYPDLETASTIVQLVKSTVTVSVPAGVAGNWDCNIAMLPSTMNQASTQHVLTGSLLTTIGTGGAGMGGVTIVSAPPGAATFIDETNPGPLNTSNVNQVVTPQLVCKGAHRVIGGGFEVVNTTASLQKQGQVMVYTKPANVSSLQMINNAGSVANYTIFPTPPGSVGNADVLFGSRQWEAEFGCYVTSKMNSVNDDFRRPDWTAIGYISADLVDGPVGNQANPLNLTTDVGATGVSPSANTWFPFDISGAYFTGLSNTTTLQVNCRWLVERCPTLAEIDLVYLAQPSPLYDPVALELYSKCMREMPPGVMLKENSLGEWFESALDVIAKNAGPIGRAIGTVIPGVGLVGTAIGVAAGGIQKLIGSGSRKANSGYAFPGYAPPAPPVRVVAQRATKTRPAPPKRAVIEYINPPKAQRAVLSKVAVPVRLPVPKNSYITYEKKNHR